jgi:hypothetical protein
LRSKAKFVNWVSRIRRNPEAAVSTGAGHPRCEASLEIHGGDDFSGAGSSKGNSNQTLDLPILIIAPQAIQRWVLERDELYPLVLSDEHWKLLEALGEILKVRATTPFFLF